MHKATHCIVIHMHNVYICIYIYINILICMYKATHCIVIQMYDVYIFIHIYA